MADNTATRSRRDAARSTPDQLEARYANYFEVGHSAFEFIFDFGQYQSEADGARMHSRLVTGPVYAKLLAELLHTALERFEEEYGVIRPAEDDLDPLEVVKQSIDGYDRRARAAKKTKSGGSTN